jgi:DNA primase
MIPQETIQTILETARIEEVVGDFVSLKKRGVNLLGLCPFHNEKTPSFTVSPAKGIYKCFGCGKSGNAVRFMMDHEHYSYPEAVKYLAAKYKIEIDEKEPSPEEKEAIDERESLLAVTAFAAKFFSDSLQLTEEGKAIGMSYFKERGFSAETIRKFQLGYSPEAWDSLTTEALKNGFKLQYLEKAGLSIIKEKQHYDRFRSRVIFPIHSLSGRVIGFGGRILGHDTSKAKYVNSPESEIYHKSATLYGIHFSRNAILSTDECFLVEGYTDVISLHQAGFENVVASSGTSLTQEQIRLIKRFTQNITILYDGDEAGIKASFRGIDMILEQDMHVKIVLFPDGEDPDSYARKHREVEVREFLRDNAVNFILFKTRLLYKEARHDPIRKTQLIKEIVSSIALIPDAISRNIYVKECSATMNISEQSLLNELNKVLRTNFQKKHLDKKEEPGQEVPVLPVEYESQLTLDINDSEYQERDIIRLLLNYSEKEIEIEDIDNPGKTIKVNVGSFITAEIAKDDMTFSNGQYQSIFTSFLQSRVEGNAYDEQYFTNHPDETIARVAIDLLSSPYQVSKNWYEKKRIVVLTEDQILAEAVTSSVLSFKLKILERMIQDNQKEMKDAENEDDKLIFMQKQINLVNAKKVISEKLGRIISW